MSDDHEWHDWKATLSYGDDVVVEYDGEEILGKFDQDWTGIKSFFPADHEELDHRLWWNGIGEWRRPVDSDYPDDQYELVDKVDELKARISKIEQGINGLSNDVGDDFEQLEARVEALENDPDDPNDPHAHLPGEWRDPDEWHPRPGEMVIAKMIDGDVHTGQFAELPDDRVVLKRGDRYSSVPWVSVEMAQPVDLEEKGDTNG